ncbi:hypothetical protein C2S53_007877 [Perilla frutescens var. hirtella]|uniref:Cupin type-1 domain-containing protein n=1 Tax=Perilla frutescens var. hirtella TaxID=608512 RepID=A0AAD4P6F3_PERFH|nr:hypothetical protein C2S53_007877 [Perilla frutescens var. hirtella]
MCISFAFDTTPLQDFCVGTSQFGACKDPKTVTPNDFSLSGLHLPGNTSNPYGASVTVVSSTTVPGLNGLGLTFMRADLAAGGFFPPHFHSRATELVVVLEGSMEVGFITSYPQYKYFSKVLNKGDVFVVPVGLVHNVHNLNKGNSVAMVAFNSQNPGITNLPNAIFAAKPAVDSAQIGACKDPITVTPNDFSLSGLHLPGNTSNPYGASVTVVSSTTVPGLNGLGLTFMRADLAVGGFFPPHFHSRATELVVVLEGSMEVGFITSYPQYKYFSKVLNKGDVFVVPVGLVHNVRNLYKGNSVAMVAFNSQNPGITNLPNAIFAAKPAVDSGYLAGAFQLNKKTIEYLQRKF